MNTPVPARSDLIVIGAGPAGYSAAVRAAQLGKSVVLIESTTPGGTCLNRGCIPTKFLWETLHLSRKMGRAGDYGLSPGPAAIDFRAVQAKKDRTVDLLVKGLRRLLESHGVVLVEGRAAFTGPGTVSVTPPAGAPFALEGERVIIAAGSRPKSIPGVTIDHARVIDSTDTLALDGIPGALLIAGGGAIGIEFATIFAGFGSRVTLAEKEDQLLPGEDRDLADEVRKILQRQGVKVITSAGPLEPLMAGADKTIVAAGRLPNTDTLDLDKAGIAHTNRGITTDEYLAASRPGVYAAGDIAGRAWLAYTAQAEGVIAAENAFGARKPAPDCAVIPRVVFSQPPAASVGLRERECEPGAVASGVFPMTASSRAFIEGERAGRVKVFARRDTGAILGGHVIGAQAGELIAVLALAVRRGLTTHDLARELFFHPSLSEALHGACEDVTGSCVDLPRK